jgi:uncharacterized RDD family membrane protein YckC
MADRQPHPEPHPDVAGYLLGALEPDEARDFADHLAGCPACQAELDALAALPGLLADLPPSVVLPPGLEARTFALIDDEARGPDIVGGSAGVGPPSGAPIVAITSARRRRAGRILTAAAAAVVVVAAGLGLASRLRPTPAPAIATIRLISADGGPARGTATLHATPAGLTIDMTVTDMAPSPPGTMYTCWLVAGDDSLSRPDRVSVGSFVVRDPSSTVNVHWTTAADIALFPHLGVTTEPSNGNPSHQGARVLVSG